MKVKSLSRVLLLADSAPGGSSPPGSSVHGIFQARVLEWGDIAFSTSWAKSGQLSDNSIWGKGEANTLEILLREIFSFESLYFPSL